jgi:hypothetical protein
MPNADSGDVADGVELTASDLIIKSYFDAEFEAN